MKRAMNRARFFFLFITLISVTIGIATKSISKTNGTGSSNLATSKVDDNSQQQQLPDEDSTYLNAVISALGGVGGGGLLLIFLLRRLVTSYDDTFAKWESRWDTQKQKDDEKNDKIIQMIDTVHGTTQELKVEIIKLQANAVDKNAVIEALTKVGVLESDMDQMRGEVKSIMTHLLNKPRTSGLTLRS